MIRISINEQQLFELIMAVYAARADGQHPDPEAARRREILLEKLHRAFESKTAARRGVMATRSTGASAHTPQTEARA